MKAQDKENNSEWGPMKSWTVGTRVKATFEDINYLSLQRPGTHLDPSGPFGPIWTLLGLVGPSWINLDPLDPFKSFLTLFGPIWTLVCTKLKANHGRPTVTETAGNQIMDQLV